ncbi:hypothetical protein LTR62_007292 [Meristemomyces frigidus]|uniref:JmjC domain-containing protein n=1 Tax=Meristemomyces frigidus TaxID=1508187 RepID=A0AAN7THE6_9PEZI|nr:hypothetical protein LTR62_007292 [Meristemomyces frigidus]
MPATRPRASFEPISPHFDLKRLVETTPNFSFVDRISCDMIDQQGLSAFEKLVLLHVIVGGKPLVIDGYEGRLDPWTFSPKWLRDNCGEKVEEARVLSTQETLPLTMGHYLKNMGKLTNQFWEKEGAYREKHRQRVYLKDIDCPGVWEDKLREQIPSSLFYLNESTGDLGGPGAITDQAGRQLEKGVARAGDLMSSLPPDMRAENLMCYIGHEGTYTPAHREMCASLGHNIMVEASGLVSDDAQEEKPGSSIWFMTESKERAIVSEYWLSVLGHDIEVEKHFAQVVAWKKAPFNVYVVEQKPGDFILIPPLAPHQVWNRGTRTMKVAWNRTTVETLEMALNEAIPRSRIVCRDEQYKNKAIVYYTLQKYSGLLSMVQQQAVPLPQDAAQKLLYTRRVKQLQKDFKKLFVLYKQILLSEMFTPEDRDAPRNMEYLPFDSNVTCAYCRGNIFNRFLTCASCKDLLGHHADGTEGDPYDVCLNCYAMGRSCGCLSGHKWIEQFRWKELQTKYETWRKMIIALGGGQITAETPLTLIEERRRLGKKTLAEVCKDQLKRRPWKDVHKPIDEPKDDEEDGEEIVVGDDGTVKKTSKKKSKTWLKNNTACHVCCKRHPNWKMAFCTTCDRAWCYGSLFRGWDKMPLDIMEDADWQCPHCLGICFAGNCRREGKMQPYEPKGTLLGHDTRKVADARSVEALVDFNMSNLNWLKDDDAVDRTESSRVKRAKAEAQRAKAVDPTAEDEDDLVDQTQVDYEYSPEHEAHVDPALEEGESGRRDDEDEDAYLMRRLQEANSTLPPPDAMVAGAPADSRADGYAPVAPPADMYPQPGQDSSYTYPGYARPSSVEPMEGDTVGGVRPFMKRSRDNDDDDDDITMQKQARSKKPRMSGAGFRSSDLADPAAAPKARTEAQRQFEREKERKALDKAKTDGRFIMLQAKLRGKKRVVKMSIPGARLAQLLAQQAAKAALDAAHQADAEHEVEEGAVDNERDTNVGAGLLLTSDIAPKKNIDAKNHFKQREERGLIVTGKTRKALIPVEKDDNYGYMPRERLAGGKRVQVTEKRRNKKSDRVYEEVDIGSDEEFEEDSARMNTQPATSMREKRNLSTYLQSRAGDRDVPDELPNSFKDNTLSKKKAKSKFVEDDGDDATSVNRAPVPASAWTIRPAGKRPRMSLAVSAPGIDPDDEADEMIDAAANGDLVHVDEAAQASSGPSKSSFTKAAAHRISDAAIAQRESDEQNRLAKLQIMEMVSSETMLDSPAVGQGSKAQSKPLGRAGESIVNMAEGISSDEESDDDGVDSVPARRGAGVKV